MKQLVALGMPTADLACHLLAVIASQLYRRCCEACRAGKPDGLSASVGCQVCGGLGYCGRVGAYEMILPDAVTAGMIAAGGADLPRTLRRYEATPARPRYRAKRLVW